MHKFINCLRDSYGKTNKNNTNNRDSDASCLSITHHNTHSNIIIHNTQTETDTFDSIIQSATHVKTVSLARIPLHNDLYDPDDMIPVRGVNQHSSQPSET